MQYRRQLFHPNRPLIPLSPSSTFKLTTPALSIVVFCEPGPDERAISGKMSAIIEAYSPVQVEKGMGYITLVASDFQRLWEGVQGGDGLGTALAVLPFFGDEAEPFLVHVDEFVIGWQGHEDEQYGDFLLLQLFPLHHRIGNQN